MLTNAQRTYAEFGQSIWYDNIKKSALENGDFARLVSAGVRGCTSNPAIFNKAIGSSGEYDEELSKLVRSGQSVEEIYKTLAIADIQATADQLRAVFDESGGADGHVSIEVAPKSAHDVDATVGEAMELVQAILRDNLMIKVPATEAGLAAITRLIGKGVSVNVTLIFSTQRYVEVAKAYIAGLEQAAQSGIQLKTIASVASFFISRIDSAVDQWLETQSKVGSVDPKSLLGKIAIANAKVAYEEYARLFQSERFKKLEAQGARPQRLLWASTSTKNPDYRDTIYVDDLIGRNTVNTVPPATLDAFQDHGRPHDALGSGLSEAKAQLAQLAELGLSLDDVCQQLLDDGVAAFAQAMDELLASVAKRRDGLMQQAQSNA